MTPDVTYTPVGATSLKNGGARSLEVTSKQGGLQIAEYPLKCAIPAQHIAPHTAVPTADSSTFFTKRRTTGRETSASCGSKGASPVLQHADKASQAQILRAGRPQEEHAAEDDGRKGTMFLVATPHQERPADLLERFLDVLVSQSTFALQLRPRLRVPAPSFSERIAYLRDKRAGKALALRRFVERPSNISQTMRSCCP